MSISVPNSGLRIVVMARDRHEELHRALSSIKKLNFDCKVEVIVSDNPSNQGFAKNLPNWVIHKKRIGDLTLHEHMKVIFQESELEWTLITHDDDILLPELGRLFSQNRDNVSIVAITGKSKIVFDQLDASLEFLEQDYESRIVGANFNANKVFHPSELINALFYFGTLFPASAIIVRSEVLRGFVDLDIRTGMAWDFELAMRLSELGDIYFNGLIPVMEYRIHGANSVSGKALSLTLPADALIVRMNAIKKFRELRNHRAVGRMLVDFIRAYVLLCEKGDYGDLKKFIDNLEEILENPMVWKPIAIILKFKVIFGAMNRFMETRRRIKLLKVKPT